MPNLWGKYWSDITAQNLMFNTTIGAGNSGRSGFLRPETAQGMFTSFPTLYRHFRERLPFGAVQVGKGYRNEISPRQGMIRLREFNMAELEYFIDPESPPEHDFTEWSNIEFDLISEDQGRLNPRYLMRLKRVWLDMLQWVILSLRLMIFSQRLG